MRLPLIFGLYLIALASSASALIVRDVRTATAVTEQTCVAPKSVSVFQPIDRQAFVWFAALQVRAGDQLRVEWVDPTGTLSTTADYGELPNAGELCFTAQLPIAGFSPASQPGNWTVRAVSNGTVAFSRNFTIAADTDNGGPVVTSVTWPGRGMGEGAQEIDFTVRGKNFQPGSLVLIAQYKQAGGWTYLASLQPRDTTANQLTVHYAGLPANEYLVIVESPDQRLSRPMPFLIATGGYKLPTAAGVSWVITQGPYGTFSHWGNSLHAFDIAPRPASARPASGSGASCVVAMKAGIAYTHDLGLAQDHRHHSFGNYVTIDHGNGEFSHYAHLATGTFVVKNGEHVEQGQALATAGNSGYTLGEGGGYHVHVSVTRAIPISSSSVPFQFEDLPNWTRGGGYRTVVSSNTSPLCDCTSRRTLAAGGAGSDAPPEGQFSGTVSVEQWWSEVIAVARGSKVLEVTLSWAGTAADLDLHLVSPSGRHYSAYSDTTGYSGETNPKLFRVPNPETGLWRISVQGMRGSGPINFGVETSGTHGSRNGLRAAR